MLSECQNVKFSVVRSDDRSLFVVSSGHRSVGLSECQNSVSEVGSSECLKMPCRILRTFVSMDADNQMPDAASP